MVDLYAKLIQKFIDDGSYQFRKAIHAQDYKAMTCVPAFLGGKFQSDSINLLIVGRGVNGWNVEWCGDSYSMARQALSFNFNMDSIDSNPVQNEGTADEYNFNQCEFIQLGIDVINGLGLKDVTAPCSHMAWSNLYKVAPALGGNPNGKMQHIQREVAIDILIREVELYKPKYILFVTGIDWMENTWRNNKTEQSFAQVFKPLTTKAFGEYVEGVGKYNDIPFVVCSRPEFRPRKVMAEQIINAFIS